MTATAEKKDPELWENVKEKVTDGDKGGRPGQWSARKAQMATKEYKDRGGEYKGEKGKDNHLQQWTDEKWGTKSGEKSGETGERYLPEKARDDLTKEEYERSTKKKQHDTKRGKQFSKQPEDVAAKSAKARKSKKELGDLTKAELLRKAKRKDIRNRSTKRKGELVEALKEAGEGSDAEDEAQDEAHDDAGDGAQSGEDDAQDDSEMQDESEEFDEEVEAEDESEEAGEDDDDDVYSEHDSDE